MSLEPLSRNPFQYFLLSHQLLAQAAAVRDISEASVYTRFLIYTMVLLFLSKFEWPNDVKLLSFYRLLMTIKVSESHVAGERNGPVCMRLGSTDLFSATSFPSCMPSSTTASPALSTPRFVSKSTYQTLHFHC